MLIGRDVTRTCTHRGAAAYFGLGVAVAADDDLEAVDGVVGRRLQQQLRVVTG